MNFKNFIFIILCLCAQSTYAQNIRGTVITPNGEAIPGATITVLNNPNSTISDRTGQFSLNLKIKTLIRG